MKLSAYLRSLVTDFPAEETDEGDYQIPYDFKGINVVNKVAPIGSLPKPGGLPQVPK